MLHLRNQRLGFCLRGFELQFCCKTVQLNSGCHSFNVPHWRRKTPPHLTEFWTASLHRFRILSYKLFPFSRNTGYRRERAILSPAAHLSPAFSCSRIQDSAVIHSSCITLTQTAEETKKLRAVWKAAVWTCQGEKGKITDRRSLAAQIQKGKKKKHNMKRLWKEHEKNLKGKNQQVSFGGTGGWWHRGFISESSRYQPFSYWLMPAWPGTLTYLTGQAHPGL